MAEPDEPEEKDAYDKIKDKAQEDKKKAKAKAKKQKKKVLKEEELDPENIDIDKLKERVKVILQ